MSGVGVRVVRGPDWKWSDQDGGEGCVGTVVKIGRPKCNKTPDKTVVVIWDGGAETNYRVGYDDAYDLRLLDNAQAGVKHLNIVCNGCLRQGIAGMKFTCCKCLDYDLCSLCYMADKHDVTHPFQRFTTPSSPGVELGARAGSNKVRCRGIFIGAKVCRGNNWDWDNQDGGEGKTGRVLDVQGWDNETERSVVKVTWMSGVHNIYRVGHKGKVDLRCVEPAFAGDYYPAHLPVLGKEESGAAFSVGDKVVVRVNSELLRNMQKGHGGWNPRMEEVIGKVGCIHRLTDKGDVRVEYQDGSKWTLNPDCLMRMVNYCVDDLVCILSDKEHVEQLQKGHGEWTEAMNNILGKVGRVVKVYSDDDLRVSIDGGTWTLNPLCVYLLPQDLSQQDPSNTGNEELVGVGKLLSDLRLEKVTQNLEKLLKEAAQGHIEPIHSFLQLHPDKVDIKVSGKTWLQVASHQGHTALVSFLLQRGASVTLADDEGDTPLHYAAFGNQPRVMEQLLLGGAEINAANVSECTPLHISVSKQHSACVKVLLDHGPDVNLQDSYGDTALHDAIGTSADRCGEVVEMLCQVPGIQFAVTNKRGFNPLHHAALKGNTIATEKLLSRCRGLVDVKKEDGFGALHLACLNGHKQTAEVVLTLGSAQIDLPNNRKYTPLMLASSQGHASVVELLVCSGGSLSAVDEDGDSSLHMVLLKRSSITHDISEPEAPTIYGIWQEMGGSAVEEGCAVAIACYLVQEGAPLDLKNSKGLTPLDLVESTHIPQLLNKYLPQLKMEKGVESRPVECIVCSELSECNVLLEPCGHRVACEDCTSRLKKCLKCHKLIDKRITPDGRIVAYKSRQPNAECLRYLESKIAEIEEVHICSICMERRKNVAFLCGHGACDKCSQTLRTCHMCRKTITKKINLY